MNFLQIKVYHDPRNEGGYSSHRVAKAEIPSPIKKEMNFDSVKSLKLEYIKIVTDAKPIDSVMIIRKNLVLIWGNNSNLNIYRVDEDQFQLQGTLDIDAANPYIWNIEQQNPENRYNKVLKAAFCLHKIDKKFGGHYFQELIGNNIISTTFQTSIPIANKRQVEQHKNSESCSPLKSHKVISFRQLDIRKNKLEPLKRKEVILTPKETDGKPGEKRRPSPIIVEVIKLFIIKAESNS